MGGMPKGTVRYPDALVAGVEAVVAASEAFESKSEFYRFASDFLLSVLDGGHEPTVLGYGDIVADLVSASEGRLVPKTDAETPPTGPFLDAYIQVRRHLRYDDVESARAVVADRYDATDREALLLDETIGRERIVTGAVRDQTRVPGPVPREREDGDQHDGSGDVGGESRDEAAAGATSEDTEGAPGERRCTPAEPPRGTDGGTDEADDAEDS